ncbi:MAG: DUF421 domain-containing protein [Clostridia bacterium]|nr:DUF421 domain-containing protein [Clostridia bacterium]
MITTIIRTVILYFLVTLGIRLMGKRQIGDMQPNELVITLLISEIAAIPLQDTSQPILSGVTAIFVLVILEIVVSVIAMKSLIVRKLLNGKSVVVIKNGVIDQKMMKNVRMTVIDLIELLRGQNVFDITTVAFAVLEVNGGLSVLLKTAEQPATVKDLNINKETEFLSLPVISDGAIIKESLSALEINRKDILKKLGKTDIKEVFLMTLDRNGKQTIIKKRDKV